MADEETTQDLDQIVLDGLQVVGEGDLVIEEETPDDPSITRKEPGDLDPPPKVEDKKEAPSEEEEPPADTPPEKDDEPVASSPEEKEAPEHPKKQFRYKNHEEAEKGYNELRRSKTRLEQEILKLKSDLEKTEIDKDFQVKQKEADEKFFDFSKKRHAKALADIDNLDPESDNYQEQVGEIWAKKDRDIRVFDRENRPVRQEPQPIEETLELTEETAREAAIEHVNEMASSEGLEPDDAFFLSQCQLAPEVNEDGSPMPFDDQVRWAINKTKQYHARLAEKAKAEGAKSATERARKKQEADLPMDRSPAEKTPADETYHPISMNDSIEIALNERRL